MLKILITWIPTQKNIIPTPKLYVGACFVKKKKGPMNYQDSNPSTGFEIYGSFGSPLLMLYLIIKNCLGRFACIVSTFNNWEEN